MRLLLILLTFCLSAHAEWKQVEPGYEFSFPRDHGSHPDYKTEWWYFTGHLGKDYGFELTVFRVGLELDADTSNPWKSQSLFIGHFAVTDVPNQKFYHEEVSAREHPEVAYAKTDQMDVMLRGWTIKFNEDTLALKANIPDASLKLALKPAKNIILHGDNGVSIKGPGTGQASLYSSFTRLLGTGTLELEGKTLDITDASVWYDHEVTSGELFEEFTGWDWFALQFNNNTELMIYQLRDKQGNKTSFSKGTFVDVNGETTTVTPGDFTLKPLRSWTSGKSDNTYPVEWSVKVPKLDIDIKVKALMDAQEMLTGASTGQTYWEGKSKITGSHEGQAYVELTGY